MIFRGYLGYEWLYLAWIGAAPKEEAAAGTPAPFSIVVLGDEDMKHKPIPCE